MLPALDVLSVLSAVGRLVAILKFLDYLEPTLAKYQSDVDGHWIFESRQIVGTDWLGLKRRLLAAASTAAQHCLSAWQASVNDWSVPLGIDDAQYDKAS